MRNAERTNPRRLLTAALAVALSVGAAGVAFAQDDLRAQAEQAWREERHADAIALYGKIVAGDPQDVFSQKRLALLLSWNDRLDESITIYREILDANPEDEEAKRELAKVYAWAGRTDESEALYEELLRDRPGDPELLVRHAELLSWRGEVREARKCYLGLIERGEREADASLGLGNLALWQGDLRAADQWYRRALDADPSDTRARVGLARAHHARGLTKDALHELDAVPAGSSGAREAAQLRERIEAETRTSLTASHTPYTDTDHNDLDIERLDGTVFVDPQSSVTATYLRHSAESNCDFTSLCAPGGPLAVGQRFGNHAESVMASYRGRVLPGFAVGGRLGLVRRSFFAGSSSSELEGGAEVSFYPDTDLSYGFGATREALLATAPLIENEIRFDTLSGNASYAFAERWQVRGEVSRSWINDDNARLSMSGSLSVRLPVVRPKVHVILSSRALRYHDNPRTGYFAPELLWTSLVTVSLADETPRRRFYYAADGSLGGQKTRLHQVGLGPGDTGDRGWDRVFAWNVLAGVNITDHLAFEAAYGHSDLAQQSATGFEVRQGSFQLRGEW